VRVVHVVILVLSAGAMVVGVLVVAGVLVPHGTPPQFRQILGIVVFLYGLYRFVVEYVRSQRGESAGSRGRRRPGRGPGPGMHA
jgi:prolipoprotein diacylglyceryltransferase